MWIVLKYIKKQLTVDDYELLHSLLSLKVNIEDKLKEE